MTIEEAASIVYVREESSKFDVKFGPTRIMRNISDLEKECEIQLRTTQQVYELLQAKFRTQSNLATAHKIQDDMIVLSDKIHHYLLLQRIIKEHLKADVDANQ